MLVLPLGFELSLTHLHAIAFISEERWEARGWWPHSHLESPPVSALVRCSYTVTFFFFLMGLLIALGYVGVPRPHPHQHPAFYHKPSKRTSFQGASCFCIVTACLRLPPAHGHVPAFSFFILSQLMLWPPELLFSMLSHPWQPMGSGCESPWWRLPITAPRIQCTGLLPWLSLLTLSSAVDSGADSHVNVELGHTLCGRVLWEGTAFSFGILKNVIWRDSNWTCHYTSSHTEL